MSADFWSGYLSGAIGIIVGNPLDLLKTRIQAGPEPSHSSPSSPLVPDQSPNSWQRWTSPARGSAAPILGYGALNALLFVTYNRSLALLNTGDIDNTVPSTSPSALSIWTAGALGGLAIFFVSAPTELVKCRAQVSSPPRSSWQVTREMWKADGVRGLYLGGGITSVRDAVGYGFYFWSYELSKRAFTKSASEIENSTSSHEEALKVLLCGGLAGVVTWVSIFPLDVIKTRIQTHDLRLPNTAEVRPLLENGPASEEPKPSGSQRPSTFRIAQEAYKSEGAGVFFRGIGICSARAFIVNAVQWAVYEWMMKTLAH